MSSFLFQAIMKIFAPISSSDVIVNSPGNGYFGFDWLQAALNIFYSIIWFLWALNVKNNICTFDHIPIETALTVNFLQEFFQFSLWQLSINSGKNASICTHILCSFKDLTVLWKLKKSSQWEWEIRDRHWVCPGTDPCQKLGATQVRVWRPKEQWVYLQFLEHFVSSINCEKRSVRFHCFTISQSVAHDELWI